MVTRKSFVSLVLMALAMWRVSIGQTNLLLNPSFEDQLDGIWHSSGFKMEKYSDSAMDGQHSAICYDRDSDVKGPYQAIAVAKGHRYVFEGHVKLLNDTQGKLWQSFKAIVLMNLQGKSGNYRYIVAYRGFCKAEDGWILLKGSVDIPQLEPSNVRFSIRGPDAGVAFLVDNLTFYEIPENQGWMGEAHTNIENHRKSNINFNIQLPRGLNQRTLSLEISLKKHLFVFGTKIEEYELIEEPRNKYTDLVYNLFNWATVQSYKWKFNKGGRYYPDFSRALNATRALLENGMKVRGHSIFWDLAKNVPEWVKQLPDEELYSELVRHVHYMLNLTEGTLQQFDIQNEHIHGHYYEERLQNPRVTKDMFRLAKEIAPNGPDLYLNDFTCITSGASTEDLRDLGMEYLSEGVPIDGLGIQGHTKEFVKPDPTSMWRRIDRLAETGLDLMMTEFDIGWEDVTERADWLEDAMRAFFGHPRMKGVILWEFWNNTMDPHHELVTGPNVNDLKLLEPGERWACLTQKEWTTKVTRSLKDSDLNFDLRGFQGDYEVVVKRRGVPVQRETFTLGKEDATVNIQVTRSKDRIDIPEEVDYVPQCISHRAEKTLGSQSTSSGNDTLRCRTVRSTPSGSGEDDAMSVTCEPEEVMTSCFSHHTDNQWTRKGEKIEVSEGGQPWCTAYNGRNSTVGVIVQARCCTRTGLGCSYRAAGPSSPFDGAMAEARCESGQIAVGCSVFQSFPDSDGVRPSDDLTSCLAQSGHPVSLVPAERSGAQVFSSCCQASRPLDCEVFISKVTSRKRGSTKSIKCPEGFTMTGCNAFAESGRSYGAWMSGLTPPRERCRTMMAADLPRFSTGARAYATCCRIAP